LVDGADVRDCTQKSLHNKIGYVPQKAVLFAGSVRSNVSYGDHGQGEITDAEVRNAVSIAQGTEFVEAMEGTYDAPIAQGGTNVSGGQKQRLAIARAVARKPEIFLFDDSFSALDYKTDRALRKALGEQTKEATKIIVAQRIGTIRHADRILVLEHGKIGKGEGLRFNHADAPGILPEISCRHPDCAYCGGRRHDPADHRAGPPQESDK
jgi:ATP-binding cassette subfamily B multidrug efflux pump